MNIRPLRDQVVLKKIIITEGPMRTAGGLFVLSQPHRDDRHTVVAVGPDCQHELIPGDVVLVHPTAPSHIVEVDREVLKFVEEKHIYGKEEIAMGCDVQANLTPTE